MVILQFFLILFIIFCLVFPALIFTLFDFKKIRKEYALIPLVAISFIEFFLGSAFGFALLSGPVAGFACTISDSFLVYHITFKTSLMALFVLLPYFYFLTWQNSLIKAKAEGFKEIFISKRRIIIFNTVFVVVGFVITFGSCT